MTYRTRGGRRRGVVIALSLAAATTVCAAQVAQAATPAPTAPTPAAVRGQHTTQRAPLDQLPATTLQRLATARLANPIQAKSPKTVNAAAKPPVDPIDMRVLVLATTGDPNPDGPHTVPAGSWDWDLSTLTSALDYTGVPYDTYKSTTKQLCVNGTWRIDYTANASASSCSSGNVRDWGASGGVTTDKLQQSATHAYYEGVMQTNGTLSYTDAGGAFVSSALSATEWSALWAFEAAFGIRTVSANTYPTADFGLTYAGEDGTSISAKYTAAATAATGPFPYVNPAGTLPIANSWRYRATISDAATTTAMITDSALTTGNVLAAVHTYPNQGNRQILALMFDSAGYLKHGQVLGYGLVNWVTKGLFTGERHAYLDPQPDDVFIADSIWQQTTPCGTAPDDPSLPEYRITGADFNALTTWQTNKQRQAISKDLTLELPFNGVGTVSQASGGEAPANDTLTPAAKANQAKYKWVNHTYTHMNLDTQNVPDAQASGTTLTTNTVNLINAWGQAVTGTGIPANTTVASVTNFHTVVLSQAVTGPVSNVVIGTTAAQATQQITQNNTVATQLGLTRYNKSNLIQPDISGLGNPAFIQAAGQNGIKYLISDTSRTPNQPSYGVNEGHYNSIDPSILEIARYPVNLYFNVSTPAQWLAEDNCLYPAGAFGHVSTYAQLLDRESDVLLRYLLQGHNRPLMFHQPNLRAYSAGKSLLGDLIDATLTKYANLVNVPITSPTQDVLGQKQANRMAYDAAVQSGAVTASIVPNTSVTVTAAAGLQKPVTVPVTGAKGTTVTWGGSAGTVSKEQYAGQSITYVTLSAGQSATVSLA